ncbi:MAG: crossover junction endodeoxyribonuclease RuvC [Anaerolineae bacterium]|nr:crossover junction endodeoxyribonuclease RuvC [Anaerolineae bacterium]
MLVIGIDPGTATTGYGLVREERDGTLTALAHGVITTPAKDTLPERLVQIHDGLSQIITLHRPQSGAVEKLFFQRNVKTAISVAQGRGVAMLALAQAGMDVGEYTPLEVKLSVVGYGGADKRQVQHMVRALLGLEDIPKPDDAADALAVAICHLHSIKTQSLYYSE